MKSHQLDTRNNYLFTYLAANLSINNQQSANAEQIINSRNLSPDYLQTSIWDLELGYARMNHLDNDAALYFDRFLKNFKGKYYVKDVLHRLSLYYYLKGDQVRAEHYRKLVLQKGSADADADKIAQKEAKNATWPDKVLLKARLLNDGGYYMDALRLLQGKRATDFSNEASRLEFTYRVGRLYDDLGRDDESIPFYKQVIVVGENRKDYYAARAALQLGYIYEQKKDARSAVYWFNRCLAMKDHDYKNSLDQRAKAGLLRNP
jgi:tetratricopeptide (TPR) repeat protein